MQFTRKLPNAEKLTFRVYAVPREDVEEKNNEKEWKFYPVESTGLGEKNDKSFLGISIPAELGVFWGGSYRFYAVACEITNGGSIQLVAIGNAPVRGFWVPAIVAIVVVLLAYVLAGLAVPKEEKKLGVFANPLRIIKGPFGRASLSSLQIIWFSLVVLGVSTYVLMRTGQLTELSMDVVVLLGIAALGTAAGKATAKSNKSVNSESYLLLQQLGLSFSPNDKPKSSDLVTEQTGNQSVFDVTKFQMLVFSLVVGIALIISGISGLSNFQLPDAFLALLGVSQAVYVGGKAISPPAIAQLNDLAAGIRKLECEARDLTNDPNNKQMKIDEIRQKIVQLKTAYKVVSGIDPDDRKHADTVKAEENKYVLGI
ncbi:MAG: hypothetical protein AW10_03823 [Candidatus Accumulibacter appositus]|uniref:Uncharacterized protein n=2 Tax=Candidatus Accumulibacter TaxID=327159 RepID=A0A011QFC3_9PROT|nr:MAG: hypothetical protein AW10_03823 [Candidatus Accumulibacter appositus]